MLGASSFGVEQKLLYKHQENTIDMHGPLLALLGLVFISALALVFLKYQNQQSFIQYNKLRSEARQLVQEGNQLTLENAALSNHRIVKEYAQKNGMHVPTGKEIVVLK